MNAAGSSARKACIVGIGEFRYTKRGVQAARGEWELVCEAVVRAAADAGIDVDTLDGVASFSNDSCLPWLMQQALGMVKLSFASMVWGGGGSDRKRAG